MKMKKIIFVFSCFFTLYSCAEYNISKKDIQKKEKNYFSSAGFALIYDEQFYTDKLLNKKMNNEKVHVMHNILKKNTPIKIINPENSKVVDAKIYNKSIYPEIFTVVVSKKIANLLDLDFENPYVEIIEVKKNKTFVAKKSNTFDEEKNVAETAPVNEVKMDDLTKQEAKIEKKIVKKYNYIVVISDFYYEESAINLMKELNKKNQFINISVKKINDKKYRLFAGPFKNFNALKTTYISLNKLGFEHLNIYKE